MTVHAVSPAGADFPALERLHARAFHGTGAAWSAGALRDLASMPGGAVFIAGPAQDPSGFALVSGVAETRDLLTLAVDPAHRRRGVGRLLLDAVAGHARDCGVTALLIEVDANNGPALALYEGAFFARIGLRRNYYKHQNMLSDAVVMQLLIK